MAVVELSIAALREHDKAAEQFLDQGYTSTTEWRGVFETSKVGAPPQLKSTASFSSLAEEAAHRRRQFTERREQRRSRTRREIRFTPSMGSTVSEDMGSTMSEDRSNSEAEAFLASVRAAVTINGAQDIATYGASNTLDTLLEGGSCCPTFETLPDIGTLLLAVSGGPTP